MYQLVASPFGIFKKYTIQDQETGNFFSLTPEFGATILQVHLQGQDLLDEYPDATELEALKWARNALLVPYPNRIKDGIYAWEGKTFQFPINNPATQNSIHGFVRNQKTLVEEVLLEKESASILCRYTYDGSWESYPFPFQMQVRYTLENPGSFAVEVTVTNTGDAAIPMGMGWHPYFQLNGHLDDWHLAVPESMQVGVDSRIIPTGKEHPFSYDGTLQGFTPDTCYRIPGGNKLEIALSHKGQKLSYWQETGPGKFPYFQLFIPPHRKAIAIEPMSCNINAFNNGKGLKTLQPGEDFGGKFGFNFSSTP